MLHKNTILKTILLFTVIIGLSAGSLHAGPSPSLPVLSDKALVSIVTCSDTPDFEGGFGHSSLRMQDASLGIDVVFNFGSYAEDQPFFVYKIFLGTVVSFLDGEPFKKFADRYKSEGRGINEYYLNLDQQQKQRLWEELNRTLTSDDRFCSFKFPTDNCSTQLRDVLFKQCGWDPTPFLNQATEGTYRNIAQSDPLGSSWSHLLLDLICGPAADRPISLYEVGFNPNGVVALMRQVNNNGQPLFMASHKVFAPTVFKEEANRSQPIILFSLLLLVAVILTFLQFKRKSKTYIWFDRTLLFISGIFGCFLFSLLLFSQIEMLSSNCNIMWALPTNLFLAFLIRKRKTALWVKLGAGLTCLSILLFPIVSAICGQVIQPEAYLFAFTLCLRLMAYCLTVPQKTKEVKGIRR